MNPLVEVRSIDKVVKTAGGHYQVIRDMSFDVYRGEFLVIMGPSGSGKSTLLGLIAGLDKPSSGEITVAGTKITSLNEDQLAKFRAKSMGIIFQSFYLLANLTSLENVALPLELIKGTQKPREAARRMLEEVELGHRLHQYPRQLSGGEQQRVAIARALVASPSVVLADEPTGNLDSRTGQVIMNLMLDHVRDRGRTLVMVSHDPSFAELADRVITLRDGQIVQEVSRRAH